MLLNRRNPLANPIASESTKIRLPEDTGEPVTIRELQSKSVAALGVGQPGMVDVTAAPQRRA